MYGYLRVEGGHGRHVLAPAQCGLCRHFGTRYRMRTRWLAGFDPSVLLLVLDGLSAEGAPRAKVPCPIPLARARRAIDAEWPGVQAVAAVQLFLAAEKLFDDRVDRKGLTARAASALLKKDIARAEAWLVEAGFPLDQVRGELRRQAGLEADPSSDLDGLSAPTARGLASVASWCGQYAGLDAASVAALRVFGDRLGRALYLVDALDDLRRDRASGAFNPLVSALGGVRSPAVASFLRGALEGRLRALGEALDGLALRRHREVLEAATLKSLRDRGFEALARLPAPAPARQLLEVPR